MTGRNYTIWRWNTDGRFTPRKYATVHGVTVKNYNTWVDKVVRLLLREEGAHIRWLVTAKNAGTNRVRALYYKEPAHGGIWRTFTVGQNSVPEYIRKLLSLADAR